jgi:hypothetical protein
VSYLEDCRQEFNAARSRVREARAELDDATTHLVEAAEQYGRAAAANAIASLQPTNPSLT